MDVQKQYQEKLTTAARAVSCVESGDWIDYGSVSYTHLTLPTNSRV